MKAVITNRIYLDANQELMENLQSLLTYSVPSPVPKHPPISISTFSKISSTICSIPVGRIDLIPKDYTVIDKRIVKPEVFPFFKGELRPSQLKVYEGVNDNSIINAPVSWGKTYTALAIAAKLGQKTLIITHTTVLRDQWVEEIKGVLGITPGIIGSSKYEIDYPIVVGNVQTVTKKVSELSEAFGTVILDEMHHVSASTFSTIIDKSKARYKVGLSGTLIRKDQRHVVFEDYFGSNIFKPEKENQIDPMVVLVKTEIPLPSSKHWADKITELEARTPEYRDLIVSLADNAARKGYKVLVVGSRTLFLEEAAALTKQKSCSITGATGLETRRELLKRLDEDIDIIFGTMSIFSEGISQNSLSCLILATPINNEALLTQLIGRICRKKEGKKTPLVIDIHLEGGTSYRQQQSRLAHYIKSGYDIKTLKN